MESQQDLGVVEPSEQDGEWSQVGTQVGGSKWGSNWSPRCVQVGSQAVKEVRKGQALSLILPGVIRSQ